MFITFRGWTTPVPAALPNETLLDDDSRRKALLRKPGLSSFVSCPACTSTDCRLGCGAVCVIIVFSSFSFLFSCLVSFLLNGLLNSTFGLLGPDGAGVEAASILLALDALGELDENLELKLPSHVLRRPPLLRLLMVPLGVTLLFSVLLGV